MKAFRVVFALFLSLFCAVCFSQESTLSPQVEQLADAFQKVHSDAVWALVRAHAVPEADPVSRRIANVARRVVKLTPDNWEICIFSYENLPPAASLQGHRLIVDKDFAEHFSDDALAWVIAHEVSHAILHHGETYFRMLAIFEHVGSDQATTPLALQTLISHNNEPAIIAFRKQSEIQADVLGMQLADLAGYRGQHGAMEVLTTFPEESSSALYPKASVREAFIAANAGIR